jgi:hypothetical protein
MKKSYPEEGASQPVAPFEVDEMESFQHTDPFEVDEMKSSSLAKDDDFNRCLADGDFMIDAGKGYINSRTGSFFPKTSNGNLICPNGGILIRAGRGFIGPNGEFAPANR